MGNYNNPIVISRADPWVYKHTDGFYYFTGSVPGYKSIELRRAKRLNDLQQAERLTIWEAHEDGNMSELIWAPEIHYIHHKWYVYFSASDDSTVRDRYHHHRMFVLENESADPFEGKWIEKGQIKTQFESFSLDGTVFEEEGELYYVWGQLDPRISSNSNLYISKMENPWTLTGRQVLLSVPEFPWEKIGFSVNEGPAVIKHGNRIFITYSASATDENYAIGLLWASRDEDLLNGFSWHKYTDPVFISSEKNQLFGPGHNSFTISEDGQSDVLIFHARPQKNGKGDPLDNPNRHAHAQRIQWDEKGFPIFGEPGM